MKITIQGHPTRGKEIIQILESLGGKKLYYSDASDKYLVFFINDKGHISCLNRKNPTVKEYRKIYTLEEFEKEFPFKIGDKVKDCSDNEVGTILGFTDIDGELMYVVNFEKSGHANMPAEELKYYKKMQEERNITLTLDKAQEWYKKGGELKEIALQAFTEKELNPLPRSWEEFATNYARMGYYISSDGKPLMCASSGKLSSPHVCPSIKSAEAHLAMIQLEQLRDCWRQGWEPIWDRSEKWCIRVWGNELSIGITTNISRFLTFPTNEMAREFLECFRDLIEKAKGLI